MKTRDLKAGQGIRNSRNRCFPGILWPSLIALAFMSACTLRLEDKNAPSFRLSGETSFDITGVNGRGTAPTPPQVKRGEGEGGHSLRIRMCLDNTLILYDAEGSYDIDFDLWGSHFHHGTPARGEGWGYRGTFLLMPGWAIGNDRFFMAPLVGLDFSMLDMDLSFYPVGEKSITGPLEIKRLGLPLGFHVETTIAHLVTPSLTYSYISSLNEWDAGLPGHDRVAQFAVRLWPGSLSRGIGDQLWIEAGWRWTKHKTNNALFDYDFSLHGPFLGLGGRF